MVKKTENIIKWNHISTNISKEDELELKSYYIVYHKKHWMYKKAFKKFKKLKLIGNWVSAISASSGIISAIVTHGTSLIAISSLALLIKSYMEHQNLDLKIQSCQYAYQNYNHIMNMITTSSRSGYIDKKELINEMEHLDRFVTDNSPIVDNYSKEYEKQFHIPDINKNYISNIESISSPIIE